MFERSRTKHPLTQVGGNVHRAPAGSRIFLELPTEGERNPLLPKDRYAVRVPDAANLLSVSRATTYRLIAAGELEVLRNGRKTMIPIRSIEAFLERGRGHHMPAEETSESPDD